MRDIDAIVYGTVCLDLIWRVDRLAEPGTFVPVIEERRTIGGEASNTAIALSRWGVRVALVGTATGDDEEGELLRRMFAEEAPDIDLRYVDTAAGKKTPTCLCLATPDGHRTMYGTGFEAMQCPVLDPALARRARVFTMDPNAYAAGLAACRMAAEGGAAVYAMDYTRSPEVNHAAEVAVTSHEAVAPNASTRACEEYATGIRDRDGCTVIVTCGENGCVVARQGGNRGPALHLPAFALDSVVDSTGAGDVFRAGLIYGKIQGWELEATVPFAAAAAALNCKSMGGWGGVRPVAEIEAFRRTAPIRPIAEA